MKINTFWGECITKFRLFLKLRLRKGYETILKKFFRQRVAKCAEKLILNTNKKSYTTCIEAKKWDLDYIIHYNIEKKINLLCYDVHYLILQVINQKEEF